MRTYSTELKWGFIFSIVFLLWMLLEKSLGWHGEKIDRHPTFTNLFGIVSIALYVFALLDKRKRDFGGKMSYRQAFVSGVIISLVVALLSPLTQWITHTLISPDFFENAIAYGVEAEYYKTEAEARQMFNLRAYILQSSVGTFVMGVITSAVVAIFVKKN